MRIVQDFAKSLRRAQNFMLKRQSTIREIYLPQADPVLPQDRALDRKLTIDGVPHLRKVYRPHEAAQACMQREIQARQMFADKEWLVPLAGVQTNALLVKDFPEESRLDRYAAQRTAEEKEWLASQALAILFDIFAAGWRHGEPNPRNFVVDGEVLRLTNFELMTPFACRSRPPFFSSPDIADGFNSSDPDSLSSLLGIKAEDAFAPIRESLLDDLHNSSKSFRKYRGRHHCRAQRTYGSFALPYLTVPEETAQRRSAQRFENFGIQESDIRGKSVLDLGSNIGAITFELQKYHPTYCVGVEYDADKVHAAQKVVALNGLSEVTFMQGDIDTLTTEQVGGCFDIVFCLAVEAHVSDRQRLFQFLGEVTQSTVYFEGNNITDIQMVEQMLRQQGFTEFQPRGMSTDDSEPTNHNRPLLVARKGR